MKSTSIKDAILLVNTNADTEKYLRQLLGGIFLILTRSLEDFALKRAPSSTKLIVYEPDFKKSNGETLNLDLKFEAELEHIPVLMLVDLDDLSMAREYFYKGIADYIVKPLVPAEVLVRVCGQLELAASSALLSELRYRRAHNKMSKNGLLKSSAKAGESASRPKLLLVDDYPKNLQALSEILEAEYDTVLADSGGLALEYAKSEHFDLIILDIVMPEMDGYQVCKHLKEDIRTREIPIIFVTGQVEAEDEIYGLELGAVDYVFKPYDVSVLLTRIKFHLSAASYQRRLKQFSYSDSLTNIPNRRYFDETYEKEFKRALRENNSLAILIVDVDHFKKYNDHFGHESGDVCLQNVAAALNHCLNRSGDFVARYGGEEFVALLPNADQAGAEVVANAMISEVNALNIEHAPAAQYDRVTISIGIAIGAVDRGSLYDKLLSEADRALYQAKKEGRNRLVATYVMDTLPILLDGV